MFYNIIVNDIAPIFVIMMLGYAGAKIHAFTPDQTQAFNKVVLDIALPAALFASITKANRELIFGDLLLTVISFAGQVGMFLLCFYICRKFWKHSIQQAAVCALITGAPTVGFLGFAVLDPVFGTSTQTGLVVAIEAILSNALLIPIGFFLM
ncbi:MAG: AEC family transporter, partial [Turicimonas muris]